MAAFAGLVFTRRAVWYAFDERGPRFGGDTMIPLFRGAVVHRERGQHIRRLPPKRERPDAPREHRLASVVVARSELTRTATARHRRVAPVTVWLCAGCP